MSAPTTVEMSSTSPAQSQRRAPYRLTELLLLIAAVAIGALAYAQVDLARSGEIPPGYWMWLGIGVGAVVAAHVTTQLMAPWSDQVLLPTVVALNGLGLALIYRLDLAAIIDAASDNSIPSLAAQDQVIWTWLGVILFVAVLIVVREPRWLQRFTYTAMLVGLVLIVLPLVPRLGVTINQARIWIRVGNLSFQPAELAKIVLIIFFAGYLVMKRDVLSLARSRVLGIDLPRGRDLGPIVVAWLVSVGVLVFERDLGTSVLFFGLFVAMLYVATERVGWLVIGAVLAVLGIAMGYLLFGHVQTRFDIWLHPFSDPSGTGYQTVQALYGLADGGILGSGIAEGHPDLVPYASSDFIAATLGELLGVTGFMAMLVLYAVIVARGMAISLAARDPFGRLLAFGLAFALGLQVFVVIGGVTNLIPLTGLTTPFLSAGGSSLVANWALVALLLRVSDSGRRPTPTPMAIDSADTQVIRR